MGANDLVPIIYTVDAAFQRVLPPLYPLPSLQTIYDTYVGLNPIVSHIVLFLHTPLLLLLLSLPFPSTLGLCDRVLPVLPLLSAAIFTLHAPLSSDRRTSQLPDARLVLMSLLLLLWCMQSLRIAYSRGDLGRRVDDFRHARIRTRVGRPLFALFSLAVTAVYIAVVCLMTGPLYFAWNARAPFPGGLGPPDAVVAAVIVAALAAKEIAARQVAEFVEKNPRQGYVTSGLYAWVRQPEVLAELVVWWGFYGFAVRLEGALLTWPVVGVFMYTVLHLLWLRYTERIIVQEFPKYRTEVQSKVWLLVPTPPRRRTAPQSAEVDTSGEAKKQRKQQTRKQAENQTKKTN